MNRKILLTLFALIFVGLVSYAIAQRYSQSDQSHKGMNHNSVAPVAQVQPKEDPPGTIDGAKNPELISDFKAYEVFFHSVAVSETGLEAKKAEAKNKFHRAKLDDKDTSALMKILGEFYHDRSNLNARFHQLRVGKASKDEFTKLDREANDLITSTQVKLSKRLSKEGVEKLYMHVMGLKVKIKLLPPPQI